MNVARGRWRRLAIRIAQHGSWVLPGARSPWADAMRRELDYIEDDRAALRWAIGCVMASYAARFRALPRPRWRTLLRPVAAGSTLMLFVALALQGHASDETGAAAPAFEEVPCDLPDVSPDIRQRLRCGSVRVPQDHAHPNSGSFSLAVVVIKSEQQPALPDPVVYINGGPGSSLTVFAAYQARAPYAPRRDLILVDQRGTGRSEPRLCPDLDRRLLEATLAMIARDGDADAMAERRAAFMSCRDVAIRSGIDLTDFGTGVTVEDFEWVRRALGIARWNVYGESYGTTVAMTLVALHPGAVRSVVLDSVYPPDPMPPWSTVANDARDAFFAHCARDELCSTSFSGLAATYREALSRLEQQPLIVDVPPRLQQPLDQVRITAPLFEILVSQLLYFPTAYPMLPRIIQEVHDGDARGLGSVIASELAAAATLNRATHAAVECRDRSHLRDRLPDRASVLDRVQLYGVCDDWSEPGPSPIIPVGASVPTLVLAGEFDPVARPATSRHVAELIGNSAHFVEFPSLGHNVRHFSPCGGRIAADFIDDPTQLPDVSCADRNLPIHFLAKTVSGQ
jgi:pimeloyl-ACP methyl ester carboxylesterase